MVKFTLIYVNRFQNQKLLKVRQKSLNDTKTGFCSLTVIQQWNTKVHFPSAENASRPGMPSQLWLSSMGTQRSMELALDTFQPFPVFIAALFVSKCFLLI